MKARNIMSGKLLLNCIALSIAGSFACNSALAADVELKTPVKEIKGRPDASGQPGRGSTSGRGSSSGSSGGSQPSSPAPWLTVKLPPNGNGPLPEYRAEHQVPVTMTFGAQGFCAYNLSIKQDAGSWTSNEVGFVANIPVTDLFKTLGVTSAGLAPGQTYTVIAAPRPNASPACPAGVAPATAKFKAMSDGVVQSGPWLSLSGTNTVTPYNLAAPVPVTLTFGALGVCAVDVTLRWFNRPDLPVIGTQSLLTKGANPNNIPDILNFANSQFRASNPGGAYEILVKPTTQPLASGANAAPACPANVVPGLLRFTMMN